MKTCHGCRYLIYNTALIMNITGGNETDSYAECICSGFRGSRLRQMEKMKGTDPNRCCSYYNDGKEEISEDTMGYRLRKAREKLGMTQDQLGRRIGRKQGAIEHYENERDKVAIHTVGQLATELGVSLDWIVLGIDHEMRWRSLDTAPIGRHLILGRAGDEAMHIGRVDAMGNMYVDGMQVYGPTHWCPLPPPPMKGLDQKRSK